METASFANCSEQNTVTLFLLQARQKHKNPSTTTMMTMIRTSSVLCFFLGLNGVGALDGLGVVDEDCVDLAKEGTDQCQDWVLNGEWYVVRG
jgi:hypothetical protein